MLGEYDMLSGSKIHQKATSGWVKCWPFKYAQWIKRDSLIKPLQNNMLKELSASSKFSFYAVEPQ